VSQQSPYELLHNKQACEELYAKHGNLIAIAKALGCAKASVGRWFNKHGIEYDRSKIQARYRKKTIPEPEHVAPQFLDLADFPQDVTAIFDHFEQAQAVRKQYDTSQKTAAVAIPDEFPIAIAFRGDWHAGNKNTFYQILRKHNEIIRDTPGMYCAELGDFCDAFIKPTMQDGAQEALYPVQMQRLYVWAAYKEFLKGKVINNLTGQHDYWASQLAGFDPVEWLSHDFEVPYLKHGGTVNLTVGNEAYSIAVRHQARGNSQWNPTHSNIRQLFFDGYHDVIAHADKHQFGAQQIPYQGQLALLVRPGSYKPYDNFSEQRGYGASWPDIPVAIFFPDRHEVQHIIGLETAAEMLRGLRKEAARRQSVS
jgi:hypothetical protein